jgi:hypothetical protein
VCYHLRAVGQCLRHLDIDYLQANSKNIGTGLGRLRRRPTDVAI